MSCVSMRMPRFVTTDLRVRCKYIRRCAHQCNCLGLLRLIKQEERRTSVRGLLSGRSTRDTAELELEAGPFSVLFITIV
jgi:hypothetical protein